MIINPKYKSYMAVIGSFLLALSLGNFYTLGNLSPYVTSYLRLKVNSWFTDSYMIWINGFFMLGDGMLMPLGGILAPKYGSRVVMSVGCVIFSGISALSAFTITKGFYAFCATYGFLSWVGAGIMSSIAIGEVMKWFPARKGLVSGLVVSGFGFGGFALNSIQTNLINPDNLSPDKTGPHKGYFSDEALLARVPRVFWITALIMASLQVIGVILLFTPPGNKQPEANQENQENEDENNTISKAPAYAATYTQNELHVNGSLDVSLSRQNLTVSEQIEGYHPKDVIKKKEFYIIWFIFAFHMIPVSYLLTYFKNYGLTFISDDHFLSTVGAIGAFISCMGKIFFGLLLDKISYKKTLAILSLGISITVQLLFAAQYMGNDSTWAKAYFTIIFFGGYIMVGGIYGIIAAVSGAAFGIKYAGANFGILFSSQAIGSFGGAFLVQIIQSNLKWEWTSFTSVVIFGVASLLLCIFLKTK